MSTPGLPRLPRFHWSRPWTHGAETRQEAARVLLLPERLGLFALATVLCCLISLTGAASQHALVPLALSAIAVAMWHGAYDHVLAEHTLRPLFERRWLPLFLISYAGLVAVTLLAWRLFPVGSLVFFLVYSAWHFGTEPEQFRPSLVPSCVALALGAVPLAAACRWHDSDVTPIFAHMLGSHRNAPHTAALLTSALGALYYPMLLVAVAGIAGGALGRALAQRGELLAVLGLQIALFAFCPPLPAFAVFFCCWHTPEHLLATSLPGPQSSSVWQGMGRNLRAGALPWLLSLAMLAVALALGRHQAVAYEGELFILLSALTVPHMLLNELRRNRNSQCIASTPLTRSAR